jgi:hypothetical protein
MGLIKEVGGGIHNFITLHPLRPSALTRCSLYEPTILSVFSPDSWPNLVEFTQYLTAPTGNGPVQCSNRSSSDNTVSF